MSTEALTGNNSHSLYNETVAANMAADLLIAGSIGRGDEVVQILEANTELLRVGDLNGDTVFHVLASGGYVESFEKLLKLTLDKNPKLLKEVAKQGNAHGDTPLHLAVKNGHKKIATLINEVEGVSFYIENDDGKMAWEFAIEDPLFEEMFIVKNEEGLPPQNENKDTHYGMYEYLFNAMLDCQLHNFVELKSSISDIIMEREFLRSVESVIYKGKILEMLEVDPNQVRHKNRRGETMLHELASCGDFEVLTKLVGHLVTTSRITGHDYQSKLPTISLLLEGDSEGFTPLHHAIIHGNMKASRYLMEVAPEAAYRVNIYGESPLYIAMKQGHDELVKFGLEVMPEAAMSPATRSSLLSPSKSSLPHAAIRFRKLAMLNLILESIPSFIDSLDDKGWKPLSYASYKGYLDEVHYLLNKFPESVKKFDSDGSLPIHKAVSGGHVCIIKAFISILPETLYSIDKKGRNILHIAVKYRKTDILCYLRDEVKGVNKLKDLRDNDAKTFEDYARRNS